MWIARDKNGELWAYNTCPIKYEEMYSNYPIKVDVSFPNIDPKGIGALQLPDEEFSEITWENSPKEVRNLSDLNISTNLSSKDFSMKHLFAIEALNGLLASGNPDDGTYVNQAVGYANLLINKLKENE